MSSQSTASKRKRKRRQVVGSEGRSIIISVRKFFKEEYDFSKLFPEPNSHLRNVTQRTSEATGVALKTVRHIIREGNNVPSTSSKYTSPLKKRTKQGSKLEIDNFTADIVRSTIQYLHVQKEIPSLTKLKTILKDQIEFDGCLKTLRRFLQKLGYKWCKTTSYRRVLMERHDVQMGRLKYLKKISEYRSLGRPVVYSDKSYFLSTGTCFIFVYAGTKDGFIENASEIYKANSTADDYHSNMSYDNYIKWLNEKLLPNLPERSVIVLDNELYDQKQLTLATPKEDMKQWLRDRGIPFEESMLKLELYDIIIKHINENTKYEIDELLESKGFDVIRVPPLHPELNAVENIWSTVKKYIALKSSEQNVVNMENLINESLKKITTETWHETCSHIEQIEKTYLEYFDLDLYFPINVQTEDSESEFESDVLDSN
ncbi:uncharacterized protein LOC112051703 [Bicyclus anynana]|uniref:Uncharacterized protein LOC112051703 n=1 Tax=Bicyclus anynana TaxID=110368 RepID=A0A6J1NML9_BICAN|nr:uncharacterized protein LOC112051703 [Bicyclus anynana]